MKGLASSCRSMRVAVMMRAGAEAAGWILRPASAAPATALARPPRRWRHPPTPPESGTSPTRKRTGTSKHLSRPEARRSRNGFENLCCSMCAMVVAIHAKVAPSISHGCSLSGFRASPGLRRLAMISRAFGGASIAAGKSIDTFDATDGLASTTQASPRRAPAGQGSGHRRRLGSVLDTLRPAPELPRRIGNLVRLGRSQLGPRPRACLTSEARRSPETSAATRVLTGA